MSTSWLTTVAVRLWFHQRVRLRPTLRTRQTLRDSCSVFRPPAATSIVPNREGRGRGGSGVRRARTAGAEARALVRADGRRRVSGGSSHAVWEWRAMGGSR